MLLRYTGFQTVPTNGGVRFGEYARDARQEKDYFQYFFELEKPINEHNLSVRLKPVKIVGEYEKILYVKLVGDEKVEWSFVRDLADENPDFTVETVN